MTMLAQYEVARAALAEATRVDEVLSLRDEMAHVKLYAQQIRDRKLMADASEFQMRVERRLGVLLQAADDAGELARKGRPKTLAETFGADVPPATLKEIGVDRKLAMKAKQAAAVDDNGFEGMVRAMRDRMASGKSIIIDPIAAHDKDTRDAKRRNDHAARTVDGGCVADLHKLAASGYKAGFILTDPQWKFLTRSEAGEGRSANIHYKTEEVDRIKDIPVQALAADDCAMGMWMVDWCPQDALDLIRHYGFKHITTLLTWAKLNEGGEGWHMGMGYWTRANPEQCYFATRGLPKRLHADVRQLILSPVMEHSRKPDAQYDAIERLVEGPYLELQARRPRKGWTSWGDELEFTGEAA